MEIRAMMCEAENTASPIMILSGWRTGIHLPCVMNRAIVWIFTGAIWKVSDRKSHI